MACPICQSDDFYVKDPSDDFEIHEFKCKDGRIEYKGEDAGADVPNMSENPEIYCQRCSWHGKISNVE